MQRKTRKIIIIFIIIAASAGLYFALRPSKTIAPLKETAEKSAQTQEESGQNTASDIQTKEPQPIKEEKPVPNISEKFLLEIPFYSQTPLSNWDDFHEEMCEEASVLNAGLYLEGKKLTRDQFETELQKMQKIEINDIGEWKSTTVTQSKELADIYFEGKINSKIINNPTIGDIEAEIAAGNPVIVPLSGRDIGNPNFTPPGPIYHMLVIKGYDSKNFITNDVGTRKGDSYTYKKEMIMENIHDWNTKDIHLGAKKALVIYK